MSQIPDNSDEDEIRRTIAAHAWRSEPPAVFPWTAFRQIRPAPLADETPADEYEHRIADRRSRASARISGLVIRFYLGFLAFAVFGSMTALGPLSAPRVLWPWLPTIAAFAVTVTAAAFAAIVTLRNWSVLPTRIRIGGLFPWSLIVGAVSWFMTWRWL